MMGYVPPQVPEVLRTVNAVLIPEVPSKLRSTSEYLSNPVTQVC